MGSCQAGTARDLSLRFIQHVALGLDAHKGSLPLLVGLYTDLRTKGAPFPPVEDTEVGSGLCLGMIYLLNT